MAGGWAKDGAVQEQIDASVADAVKRARASIAAGESLTHREECGEAIPPARREAVPGGRQCIPCQEADDAEQQNDMPINRRASKDSQLR